MQCLIVTFPRHSHLLFPVSLLNSGPNPIEHICDEIVKNYVIICGCIIYVQFFRCWR